MFGTKNPNSKLTEEDLALIRRLLKVGEPCREIANTFGVHKTTIERIRRGARYPESILKKGLGDDG